MWIDPLGLNPALALGGYELWMLLFGGAVVVAGQQATQSGGFTGSRSSAGEAAVSVSDVGRCNRPEPKCPPNVFEKLTENVNKAKELTGALGSCSQHMSKYDLKMREKAWLKHALARSIREQTCWDGGDKGHQMAIAAAWKNYYKCKDFLL